MNRSNLPCVARHWLFSVAAASILLSSSESSGWQDGGLNENAKPVVNQGDEPVPGAKSDESKQTDSQLPVSPLLDPDRKIEEIPPWEKLNDTDPEGLPTVRPVTTREMLINVDDGELDHLYDYDPVDPESIVLIKIMYRLQKFREREIVRFITETKDLSTKDILSDPAKQRLLMFRFQGRAREIKRLDLVDEVAQLFPLLNASGKVKDFHSYYQVRIDLDDCDETALVCLPDIPESWKTAETIDEPVVCPGMFLKINSHQQEPAVLLVAAKRIQWYPTSSVAHKSLNQGLLTLAKAGFDVALMDDAKARNRKSMDEVDSPCFLQLLSAANRLKPADVKTHSFDLVKLLKEPERHLGQSYMVEVEIRQITEIQINDEFQQQQLNLKRYYHLDGIVNTPIAIVDPKLGNYGNRFPVVVCVPSLPEGMSANSNEKYRVSLPAFFFRIWPYNSKRTQQLDPRSKQYTPLMIGLQPHLESNARFGSAFFNAMMTIFAVGVFAFIWFGFWKLSRQSRISVGSQFKVGGSKEAREQDGSDKPKIDFPKIDV